MVKENSQLFILVFLGMLTQDYLKHLFECILHGKDCDKKVLLPCFYKSEC